MDWTGDHAVVLGGSMAGVLAARVLTDRYRKVTVVDRDRFPAVGMRRKGVPQDRHIHALQTLGKRTIDELFPGMAAELVDQGAVAGDWGRDVITCFSGHRLRLVDAGLDLLALSRPLLEGHLRARLATLPGVALLQGCDVQGLVFDPAGTRVAGARVLRRDAGGVEEALHADLVVDATGRASRLPHWLEAAGYAVPEVDETGLEVAYTSCRFPRLPSDEAYAIIVGANPPDGRRGGGAIAVEGDSWVVTLGGVLGEQAPTDLDGFVAYAATLSIPDVYDLVRDREPLGDPVLMRYPTSRRRRYERLERFPERLVVTGDALCSFNPVYGQGMSVAAAEALALRDCLEDLPETIGPRVLAAAAPVVDDAWGMAWSGDAQFLPELAVQRSWPERLVARYQGRLVEAAAHDPVVSRAFREVMAMVARPPSLVRPRVAARVLAGSWGRHRRRRGAELPAAVPASRG